MRRAFTLLEMMIAISILAIIMLFLYESLSKLQQGNRFYEQKLQNVEFEQTFVKTLYLDLALAQKKSLEVISKDKQYDILLMQTQHSIHKRIMPYVGYLISEEGLFRVESSQKLNYPLQLGTEMLVDKLGKIEKFRIYRTSTHTLVNIKIDSKDTIFKTRLIN